MIPGWEEKVKSKIKKIWMDHNKKPELTRYNSININVTSTFTYRKIKLVSEEKDLN